MIPKTIHYCWFGGKPLPEDALKCIESWKKYCPDFELREWNETNFDFSECQYACEAYAAKKWAFVSDYARFRILYDHGGVYFDTDVELLRPIDHLLEAGPFMGFEKGTSVTPDMGLAVAPGLGLAAEPGMDFYKTMIDKYKTLHFLRDDGTNNLKTVVMYTTEELIKCGLQNKPGIQTVSDIILYPPEYFCPKDYQTGTIQITDNTYSIHHFKASWHSDVEAYTAKLAQIMYGKVPSQIAGPLSALIAYLKIKGIHETAIRIKKHIKRCK